MDSDDPFGVDALPKFDAVFDFPRRLAALAGAAQGLATAGARYQSQYAAAWWSSWVDHSSTRSGDALLDLPGFLDAGFEQANRALLELQNSEPFLAAQRELVGSIARFRSRHRQVTEVVQAWNHTPTRRDLDEVTESLYDLRREVRRLRRRLAEAEAAPAPDVAPPQDPAAPDDAPVEGFRSREVAYGTR